jgi:hypothetical protein
MLSIGTFGMGEGNTTKSCGHLDELSRLQEELKSLATANELGRVNHLQLERLLSSSSTSRTLATRAFGGFGPRPSLRETVPEMRFDEVLYIVQVALRFQNRIGSEFRVNHAWLSCSCLTDCLGFAAQEGAP